MPAARSRPHGLVLAAAVVTAIEFGAIWVLSPEWMLPYGWGPAMAVVTTLVGIGAVAERVRARVTPVEGEEYTADVSDDDPFPIADARSRAEAVDCIRRTLAANGIAVGAVVRPHRHKWGWEITVRQKSGTPAEIVSKAGAMETPWASASTGSWSSRTRRSARTPRCAW